MSRFGAGKALQFIRPIIFVHFKAGRDVAHGAQSPEKNRETTGNSVRVALSSEAFLGSKPVRLLESRKPKACFSSRICSGECRSGEVAFLPGRDSQY